MFVAHLRCCLSGAGPILSPLTYFRTKLYWKHALLLYNFTTSSAAGCPPSCPSSPTSPSRRLHGSLFGDRCGADRGKWPTSGLTLSTATAFRALFGAPDLSEGAESTMPSQTHIKGLTMLRTKKKAEEAKKLEEAKAAAAANGHGSGTPMDVDGGGGAAKEEATVSILGIGGQSVRTAQPKGRRRQPAELRIQKDLSEVEVGSVATVEVPNPNDLTVFNVDMTPESGLWGGARYRFLFRIPPEYPHTPPKVTCTTRILHPNIDFEGNVCLNILRQEWKPILDINTIIYGLLHLFLEPNPDDPLNKEAAELFRNNPRSFEQTVRQTLRGCTYQGHPFERLVR